METKQRKINDFELEIDYEIREGEPENGINAGFDIHKVTILDCDLFKAWREHFKIFLDETWQHTFIFEISEIFNSEEGYELGAITGLKSFCNIDVFYDKVYIYNCILKRSYHSTHSNLSKMSKKIQDYLSEDMYGTDITEIVDHATIENELNQ